MARPPLLLTVRSPSIDMNIASESKSDAGSWLLAGSLRGSRYCAYIQNVPGVERSRSYSVTK